jgi:hypothetical protein
MPFHVLGTGVLGSCPGMPAQQAYFAGPPTPPPPAAAIQQPSSPDDVWNHQATLAVLTMSGVSPSGPQVTEWFLDTGAMSHMVTNPGNFPTSQALSHSAPITVSNSDLLLVTHRASTAVATTQSQKHTHFPFSSQEPCFCSLPHL